MRDFTRRENHSMPPDRDRKSTRLNSSHLVISYAVFCLKKKTHHHSADDPFVTRLSRRCSQHSLRPTFACSSRPSSEPHAPCCHATSARRTSPYLSIAVL